MEDKKKRNYYTEAQKRSAQKYLADLAEIKLRMLPEEKEKIKQAANTAGKSVNGYILEAVNEKIEKGDI